MRLSQPKTKNLVTVSFTHDENCKLWEVKVHNVEDEKQAKQAFYAVVVTCQMINANLQQHAKVQKSEDSEDNENTFIITPAVQNNNK